MPCYNTADTCDFGTYHIDEQRWLGWDCVIAKSCLSLHCSHIQTCADPGGGGDKGIWTPLKNHKNIGFSGNTGLDPLKNHKATCTKPAFNVGPSSARQRNAFQLAFRWRAGGGPLIMVSLPSSKKPLSKLYPLWQNFLNPRMYKVWKWRNGFDLASLKS